MHIGHILHNDYKLELSPGRAVDIRLGLGFDMSDPLVPQPRVETFAVPDLTPDMPTPDDLVLSSYTITESTSYREEARKLAVSFSAMYGIFSGNAAYSSAKKEIEEKKILYIEIKSQGQGISIPAGKTDWSSPPTSESIDNLEERRRQFLLDHGSHYVSRVYYGQKIVIRASYHSKNEEERESFSAAVKAMGASWGGGLSVSPSQEKILRSNKTDISVGIIAAKVEPAGAFYLSGYDDVKSFLAKLKSGDIRVTSGPIECDLTTYWHTLSNFTSTRSVFSLPETISIPAENGVPSGTILSWNPPSESIRFDVDQNQPIEIIPPKGWLICDGTNGTPDLVGRFPRGMMSPIELQQTGGEVEHSHRVSGISDWEAEGIRTSREGADNFTGSPNWNHKHRFDVLSEISSSIPPYAVVAFIMKG